MADLPPREMVERGREGGEEGIWYLRFRLSSRGRRGRDTRAQQWIAWITSEYLIIQLTCWQTGAAGLQQSRRSFFTVAWMDLSVFAGINWPEERRGREEERFGYAVLLFDFTPDREIMPPIWWNMPATIEPSFERPVYFGGKNRWIIRSMLLSHVFGYYNEMVKSRSEGQIGVMGSMVQWWWLMWHIWKLEKGWRRRKGGGESEASMCITFYD